MHAVRSALVAASLAVSVPLVDRTTLVAEQGGNSSSSSSKGGKVALLLTVHNSNGQNKMYEDVIEYYVSNSGLSPIFVVCAYNVNGKGVAIDYKDGSPLRETGTPGFPELESKYGENGTQQLRVLTFAQEPTLAAAGITPNHNAGIWSTYERFEMAYAMKHLDDLQNYQYVAKLTGKYRVPALGKALLAIPESTDIVLQSNHGLDDSGKALPKNSQAYINGCGIACSELYAMRPSMLSKFIDFLPPNFPDKLDGEPSNMERYLSKFVREHNGTSSGIHRLESLEIPSEFRVARRDGSSLERL